MSEPVASQQPGKIVPACIWPGCGNFVRAGDPLCRDHYYLLPYRRRSALWTVVEWVRAEAAR
jgi:hypothetical protein